LRLQNLFKLVDDKRLVFSGEAEKFEERIFKIIKTLTQICEKDPDAALGSVHLSHSVPYIIYHPVQVAILSEIVANRMEIDKESRIALMAAALTQNLSILNLQHKLTHQKEPLSIEQRKMLDNHCSNSVEILKYCGVNNTLWLNSVLNHHETIDGNGYPNKLPKHEISIESQILGLADCYGAKVSNRTYKSTAPAKDVLFSFFTGKHKEYCETLILAFIKELGIFPPGSFVTLNNGETAVVIRRQKDTPWPMVSAVLSPRGGPYARPLKRATDSEQFGIKSACTLDKKVQLNHHMLWGYL